MIDIKENFLNEAISAPYLFNDLAKVELYIAESYRTRAIIEMLQNADDAKSTEFLVLQDGNKLIVANNGAPFTKEDIISLCRSGSSTKIRGAGKIGYRGIGFKSVVGICNNVKIFSQNLFFEFSKSLTQKELKITEDVPLIRIPHILTGQYKDDLISSLPNLLSYNTLFILSGIDIRLVEEEVNQFNSSSILFLNNIKKVTFNINGKNKEIIKSGSINSKIEINSHGNSENWYVTGKPESSSKVAFKLDNNNNIVPAYELESVIHAFLPTEENPGVFLKINGNFSTEPSRKRIDLDELSINSFKECSSLIVNEIKNAFNGGEFTGLFSIFKNAPNGRFKKLLKENLVKLMEEGFYFRGQKIKYSLLKLKPKWLNYKDYTTSSFEVIPLCINEIYPEIHDFFAWLGVQELSVEEYLSSSDFRNISHLGCFELISYTAKKYRFILPDHLLEKLKTKAIFPTINGIQSSVTIQDLKKELHADYLTLLKNAENESDIMILFKKIGFNKILLFNKSNTNKEIKEKSVIFPQKHFTPQVKKWRSAELNVKEWFSTIPGVLLAKDISKSHLGYDIEVKFKDGREYFVEVKSVNSFSDSFEITNNEYAIGSQLKNNYLIAIVIENKEQFIIKFIKNPITVLNFEKRIKSISWVCDTYDTQLTDF